MANYLPAPDLDHILNHTRDVWENLRGERIFITGGTGFFGRWLLESFVWANQKLSLGAKALILSRNPQAFIQKAPNLALDPSIMFLQGNVVDFNFPDEKFPFIIHAATEANAKLNDENPLIMLDTIVDGTRHVLDFSQECGARRFLLTSSGAVYGPQPPDLSHVPETFLGSPDPLDMRSAYGQGKRIAEHLCALYSKPGIFEPSIARCFAFVGPYLPPDQHFAIGNFISDGLNGGPIIIRGDGTPYRSYLYAADLAIWLWTILFKGQSCRPYNVGSDFDLPIMELANVVKKNFNSGTAIQLKSKPKIGQLPLRYVPLIDRCRSELELDVWISLEKAIANTVLWYRRFFPNE